MKNLISDTFFDCEYIDTFFLKCTRFVLCATSYPETARTKKGLSRKYFIFDIFHIQKLLVKLFFCPCGNTATGINKKA